MARNNNDTENDEIEEDDENEESEGLDLIIETIEDSGLEDEEIKFLKTQCEKVRNAGKPQKAKNKKKKK